MYARLARFEGSDPTALEKELQDMRGQMSMELTDEALQQMNEQMGGQFDTSELQALRKIKRTLVLADVEQGTSSMVVFADTEADIKAIHDLFDRMSPSDEGGGKRQSVDIYKVEIDQATG